MRQHLSVSRTGTQEGAAALQIIVSGKGALEQAVVRGTGDWNTRFWASNTADQFAECRPSMGTHCELKWLNASTGQTRAVLSYPPASSSRTSTGGPTSSSISFRLIVGEAGDLCDLLGNVRRPRLRARR